MLAQDARLVLCAKTCAHLLGDGLTLRTVRRTPVAFSSRTTVLVDVIHVAKDRETCVVVVIQSEETSHIAVACTSCRLGIGYVATVVLALQLHVHHVVFLLNLCAYQSTLLGRLVVYLQVLYRVVRQIVEHNLVVALEEVLAVEREVVNLLAIHIDVAIALYLSSRQLAHKGVEHRAVGHVEGAGIIHECVATIGELHLGARHHHSIQVHLFIYIALGEFLKVKVGHLEAAVACHALNLVVLTVGSIALTLCLDNIFRRLSLHFKARKIVTLPSVTGNSVDHRTVLAHQCDMSLKPHTRKRVLDNLSQHYSTLGLVGLGILCCSPYHIKEEEKQ